MGEPTSDTKTRPMLNRVLNLAIGLVAAMVLATPSYAEPRSGHEWFLQESDYVVIAKAQQQRGQAGFDNIPIDIATLEIMSVLKGQITEKTIDVVVKSESMEQTANCCTAGKVYLMYLVKTNRGLELIRGRDGVYRLEVLRFKGRRR